MSFRGFNLVFTTTDKEEKVNKEWSEKSISISKLDVAGVKNLLQNKDSGKLRLINVWATWCGPCKAEIPSLKKIEKQYHGKNIAFVSMSIDDDKRHKGSWENAHKAWKKFVEEKYLVSIEALILFYKF